MPKRKSIYDRMTSYFKTDSTPDKQRSVVSYRSISDDEIENIHRLVTERTRDAFDSTKESLNPIIDPIFSKLEKKVTANDKLEAIAPEIGQAGQIYISSILSPNDLRTHKFAVEIPNSAEDTQVLDELNSLFSSYFGDHLKLKQKLPVWLYDTLYRHGAKPVMVVPSTTIENAKLSKEEEATETLTGTVEATSISLDEFVEEQDQLDKITKSLNRNVAKGVDVLNSEGLFSVSTDFSAVRTPDKLQKELSSSVSSSLENLNFESDKLFTIDTETKEEVKHVTPARIELPYESVVPLVVEGAPSSPVGYIVLVNEHGSPVKAKREESTITRSTVTEGQRVADLYQAFFGNTRMTGQENVKSKYHVIEKVLSSYFEKIAKSATEKANLTSVSPELSSAVMNVLFFRTLRKKKTKFVFVPVELMMYMAFDYNDDGTGKSMIDDIIMPLAFKNTLIVTRLLALIETATPRKKIEIDIDDNMPNPQEVIRAIRAEVKKNKSIGISHDPVTVVKNHADREISVIPKRIPGVTDFSIETEDVNVDYPQPDDGLLETIDNMITQQLGVTPSSLNRLREEEFATSVVSNNLFLSNSVVIKQDITCDAVSKLMRVITKYDSNLQRQILDILEKNRSETEPKSKETDVKGKDDGVIDLPSDDTRKRLKSIVDNLTFILPSPTIVADKAQFEEINNFISIVQDIVDAIYDEGFVKDSDMRDTLTVFKTAIKSQMIQTYIRDQQVFLDAILSKNNMPVGDIAEMSVKLSNLDKLLKDAKEKLAGDDSGGSSGGGYGY